MGIVSSLEMVSISSVTSASAHHGRRKLHRLGTVRRQQGLSVRRVAQLLKCDARTVRMEEDPYTDLPLERLYQWQAVLEVPIADLLEETGLPLSPPVLQRARLVRIMKTVAAIKEKAESPNVKRLTETLSQQLIELMPELKDVNPWHSVGHRRSLEEYGRIVDHPLPEDFWKSS